MTHTDTPHRIYYKITGVGHWFTFTFEPPKFWRDGVEGRSTRENSVCFPTGRVRDAAFCSLWSTLHYWLYQVRTNCRDFNPSDIEYPPVPDPVAQGSAELSRLAKSIVRRLDQTSGAAEATYKVGGSVRFQVFRPRLAKSILDEIDVALAQHYGFTDEELDFVINYDIKYRMGGMRLPTAWKSAIAENRMLMASTFDAKHRRATADLVAAGKTLWTLDDPANAHLIALGIRPLRAADASRPGKC